MGVLEAQSGVPARPHAKLTASSLAPRQAGVGRRPDESSPISRAEGGRNAAMANLLDLSGYGLLGPLANSPEHAEVEGDRAVGSRIHPNRVGTYVRSIRKERSNVDKQSLERLLDQGESVERIAARFGKDPSTISYWMKKYGLTSPYAEKHAAKGGIERERLEGLVEAGLSIAEIATEVGRSNATVRHWLRRHELKSRGGRRRAARKAGLLTSEMMCPRHGHSTFSSKPAAAIDASGVEWKTSSDIARN